MISEGWAFESLPRQMVQLIQTVEKLLQLFLAALIHAPPFPPYGFWAGSALLAAGTCGFITSSEATRETTAAKERQD